MIEHAPTGPRALPLALLLALLAGCYGALADDDSAPIDDPVDDDAGDDDAAHDDDDLVDDAAFVDQEVPATVTSGQPFEARFTLRNTGTTTWTSGEEYRLGSQAPKDSQTWGTGRIELEQDVEVGPGDDTTFVAALTAPGEPGTATMQWRMVREHVTWFGQPTDPAEVEILDACADHCGDGASNCGETDIDCGGGCPLCPIEELWPVQDAIFPTVAATADRVLVAWSVTGEWGVHWSCRDGNGWTAPAVLDTGVSFTKYPRAQADSQGRIHLVVTRGGGDAVVYARFDGPDCSGSAWTPAVELVTLAEGGGRYPQVAVDDNDDPHVCWHDQAYTNVYTRRATAGSWSEPIVPVTVTPTDSRFCDISVQGISPHVVWEEDDFSYANARPRYARWTGAAFSAIDELQDSYHSWPQLVVEADGDAHVLYTRRYGDQEVKYRFRSDGAWQEEQVVSSGPTEWTWSSLALRGDELHATWSQTVQGWEQVHVVRGDAPGGTWEDPRRLPGDEGRHGTVPALSIDPDGFAHLAWLSSDAPMDEGRVLYRKVAWQDLEP